MGFFDRQIRKMEDLEEEEVKSKNLGKMTSDKAVEVIKELSGKQYKSGKKMVDNIILFTNAAGGAGASTIASNVAFTAVTNGIRTLIIDLNIMCPVQHTYLGIDQQIDGKKDIVSFLVGEAELHDCIDSTSKINLLFANNRTLSDEIRCNEKIPIDNFAHMIGHLRNYYDLVIIDCPMRVDTMLCNTAMHLCDAIYMVWEEGMGSIINTEKIRRNLALSGVDSYTKMRVILNKRTDIGYNNSSLNQLNIENVETIPFSVDIIDNSLRGRIFCDKGSATNKNSAEFARRIGSLTEKILKIGGYVK